MIKEQNFILETEVEIEYDSIVPKGFTFESHETNLKIKYSVDLSTRNWGIHSINFACPEQEVTGYIELANEMGDSDSYLVTIKLSKNEVDNEEFSTAQMAPNKAVLSFTSFTQVNGSFVAEGSIELSFE